MHFKKGDTVVKGKPFSADQYSYNNEIIKERLPIGTFGVVDGEDTDDNTLHVTWSTGERFWVGSRELISKEEYVKATATKVNKTKFDQVVLPKELRDSIVDAITQAKSDVRKKIFVDWGFDDTIEKGKGVVLLFWGKPGTGKTMLAEGIADYLGKNYLLLGSGNFQSSIPGQTERNIKDSFQRAKDQDLVIILDECDGVLYSREEVGSVLAAEINALLTEIERFEGVCILTTNRPIRLDAALERRISLKAEFPNPTKELREEIWKKLIPRKAPLARDVNFHALASAELTGGQIKNALLNAARKAAARNANQITQEDFLTGIERELLGQKMWKKEYGTMPITPTGTQVGVGVSSDKVRTVMVSRGITEGQ